MSVTRTHFVLIFMVMCVQLAECKMEAKVVGGESANILSYPHAVYIVAECMGESSICGGSILNQKLLLTAAHCITSCKVTKRKKDIVEFYAGHENLEKTSYRQKIIDTKIHEKYATETVTHDVAILLVKNNIPLGKYLQRVIIMKHIKEPIKEGKVAGWGIIDESKKTLTSTLQYVRQKIQSESTCARIGKLDQGMFCAGSINRHDPRPSSGDSGSAMIAKAFYQIGLVSFKIQKLPALMVYTNVTYFSKWIYDNAKQLYCKRN